MYLVPTRAGERYAEGCVMGSCLDRPSTHSCAGSTRKEEIERFSKASKDTDFARMLKARMLSPDHLETQSQLRREIRVRLLWCICMLLPLMTSRQTIRGRLQQLEDYIQSSKKKLNSVKSGKPTIKYVLLVFPRGCLCLPNRLGLRPWILSTVHIGTSTLP